MARTLSIKAQKLRCSVKEAVLKYFSNFTGKQLCWRPEGLQLYQGETPTQAFCCLICEIFKNTYFEQHMRTTFSERFLNTAREPLRTHMVH